MLRDMLTLLNSVSVTKTTKTSNGMGGTTTATVTTTLSRALIWQSGGGRAILSEKVANDSTHVLAMETGEYDFTYGEGVSYSVGYDSRTYRCNGHADDVAEQGVITVVGLERIT